MPDCWPIRDALSLSAMAGDVPASSGECRLKPSALTKVAKMATLRGLPRRLRAHADRVKLARGLDRPAIFEHDVDQRRPCPLRRRVGLDKFLPVWESILVAHMRHFYNQGSENPITKSSSDDSGLIRVFMYRQRAVQCMEPDLERVQLACAMVTGVLAVVSNWAVLSASLTVC
jgi:hypothetical protein